MFKNIFDNLFGKGDKGVSLLDLDENYSFSYKGVIWQIIEVHTYDWGEEGSSIEYKIIGDGQEAYLEVEDDEGNIVVTFCVLINVNEIEPNIINEKFNDDDILNELDYSGQRYELDEIYDGFFKNVTNFEMSQKVTNYNYIDGKHFISIDKWDDGSFEFSAGQTISKDTISKIKSQSNLKS